MFRTLITRIFQISLGIAIVLTLYIGICHADTAARECFPTAMIIAGIAYLITALLFPAQDNFAFNQGILPTGACIMMARVFLYPCMTRISMYYVFFNGIKSNVASVLIIPFLAGAIYFMIANWFWRRYMTS